MKLPAIHGVTLSILLISTACGNLPFLSNKAPTRPQSADSSLGAVTLNFKFVSGLKFSNGVRSVSFEKNKAYFLTSEGFTQLESNGTIKNSPASEIVHLKDTSELLSPTEWWELSGTSLNRIKWDPVLKTSAKVHIDLPAELMGAKIVFNSENALLLRSKDSLTRIIFNSKDQANAKMFPYPNDENDKQFKSFSLIGDAFDKLIVTTQSQLELSDMHAQNKKIENTKYFRLQGLPIDLTFMIPKYNLNSAGFISVDDSLAIAKDGSVFWMNFNATATNSGAETQPPIATMPAPKEMTAPAAGDPVVSPATGTAPVGTAETQHPGATPVVAATTPASQTTPVVIPNPAPTPTPVPFVAKFTDPGFELAADSGNLHPEWKSEFSAGMKIAAGKNGFQHSGTANGYIYNLGTADGYGLLYQNIQVDQGKKYVISAWVRCTNPKLLHFEVKDAAGVNLLSHQDINCTPNYTRVSGAQFTAPATTIRSITEFQSYPGSDSFVQVDDYEINVVP